MRICVALLILSGMAIPVAIPVASACYSNNPVLNYVVCGSEKFDDINALTEQAMDTVQPVLDQVDRRCEAIEGPTQDVPPAPDPASWMPTAAETCDDPNAGVATVVTNAEELPATLIDTVLDDVSDPPTGPLPIVPSPSPSPSPVPRPEPTAPGPSPSPPPGDVPSKDDVPVDPTTTLPELPLLPRLLEDAPSQDGSAPAADPNDESQGPQLSTITAETVAPRIPIDPGVALVALLILTPGGLYWLNHVLFPNRLYNHLTGDRVAMNALRQRLLELIRQHPASTVPGLARALAVHPTTVSYHLRVLERYGHVVVHRNEAGRTYFENHGRYDAGARKTWAALERPAHRRFLEAFHETGGRRLADVAALLGVSVSTAGYRATKLVKADLLVRDGQRWRLSETAMAILRPQTSAAGPTDAVPRIPRAPAAVPQTASLSPRASNAAA